MRRETRWPHAVATKVDAETLEGLDHLAAAKGLSRADAARDAISRGLPLAIDAQRRLVEARRRAER